MSLFMGPLNGFSAGGFDQAEGRGPCLVEPIGQEAYAVFALGLQILFMRVGKRMAGCPLDVMAVM